MAGPVMCAGITLYEPLKMHGVTVGSKVGIIGLGGLGQMGVKLAKAMGAIVTVLSRAQCKEAFARSCGADIFLVSSSPMDMSAAAGKLDLLINTIPSYHDYFAYQPLLNSKGIQILLGLHAGIAAASIVDKLVFGRSRIKMSTIGGIKATQEVIDLCDRNKIFPEIKIVSVTELNSVYTMLDKANESGVRYVLDIANTLKEGVQCNAAAPKLGPNTTNFSLCGIIKECCYLLCSCKWC